MCFTHSQSLTDQIYHGGTYTIPFNLPHVNLYSHMGVTLFLMFVMWCLNVINVLVYYTMDFGCECVCGRGVLLIVRCGICWCSAFQFVSKVTVDLAGAKLNLFVVQQWCSVLR